MRYDILLTKSTDNGYIARPMLWPEVVASGSNEAEALAGVRVALSDLLAKSHIVQIELAETSESADDPWLKFAGMWQDIPDEQWAHFQAAIDAVRQSIDRVSARDNRIF